MAFDKTLTALALTAMLAACGGGTDREPPTAPSVTAQSTAPLLDDEGGVMAVDPAAVPADAGARTANGLYATRAQADTLERTLGNRAVAFDVGCCNGDADLAVLLVYAQQAAYDLDNTVPVLLRGADQRLAAAVANRLLASGFTRVWLVGA